MEYGPSLTIKREELAENWPFTVREVKIYRPGLALVVEAGGRRYAGNGAAIGQLRLPKPEPIWKIERKIMVEGERVKVRKDIGLFIAYALSRKIEPTPPTT